MKLDTEFIKLPFTFDVARLVEEAQQFSAPMWMAHPNNFKGNSAIALISLNGEDNNDFNGQMKITPHLEECEYIQQIMSGFGEIFGRSRLMRLEGGCDVSDHIDANYHWYNRVRIHIPIITYPDVLFYCGDKAVHMAAGECWIFNSWLNHKVVNATPHTRIHLVMDTSGSARFWEMVGAAQNAFLKNKIPDAIHHVKYESGKKTTILTERFNASPIMSPGEVDALVEDIIADCLDNNENDVNAFDNFIRIVRAFCKEWRCLWLLHGMTSNGVVHYQKLIKKIAGEIDSLYPKPLTKSNYYDATKVFFSRVLYAACCPNVLPQFMGDNMQSARPVIAGMDKPAPKIIEKSHAGRNELCHCGSGKKFKHCHGSL